MGGEGQEGEGEEERLEWRDHVNALGLPNDGYDYGRHLKRMGAWVPMRVDAVWMCVSGREPSMPRV